jgi:hypothetical protein
MIRLWAAVRTAMEHEPIGMLLILSNNDHRSGHVNILPICRRRGFVFALEARKFNLTLLKPAAQCKDAFEEYDAFIRKDGRPAGTGAWAPDRFTLTTTFVRALHQKIRNCATMLSPRLCLWT